MSYLYIFKRYYKAFRQHDESSLTSCLRSARMVLAYRSNKKDIFNKYELGSENYFTYWYLGSRMRDIEKRLDAKFEDAIQQKIAQRERQKLFREISNFGSDIGGAYLEESSAQMKKVVEKAKEIIANPNLLAAYVEKGENKRLRQKISDFFIENASLYNQSLQNLLEGQREVTRNEEFKFEDGTTVKDRMNKFEVFLKSKMPKYSLRNRLLFKNKTDK